MVINNIIVTGNCKDKKEIKFYIDRFKKNHPNDILSKIDIDLDGEYANITYKKKAIPFERIRRITGYLVGNMDRWNDAKTSEERDRVKHSVV